MRCELTAYGAKLLGQLDISALRDEGEHWACSLDMEMYNKWDGMGWFAAAAVCYYQNDSMIFYTSINLHKIECLFLKSVSKK